MESQDTFHIGIETGGTSCKVGIMKGSNSQNIISSVVIDTTEPQETLDKIIQYINSHQYQYKSLGIACFGPIDLDKNSDKYGYITTTPKVKWQFTPVLPKILEGIKNKDPNMKISFDTDVNIVAKYEHQYGNHNIKENLAYVTVGTGIGIGIVVNGQMVHGLIHPEGGHIKVPILPSDNKFEGVCEFHKNCLEGLCTNVSIAKRLGIKIEELSKVSDENDVWDRIGYYLGVLCANLALTMSLEKIIIGGGVMNRTILYDKIRQNFLKEMNGYLKHPNLSAENISKYIVPPSLDTNLGVIAAAMVGAAENN